MSLEGGVRLITAGVDLSSAVIIISDARTPPPLGWRVEAKLNKISSSGLNLLRSRVCTCVVHADS